MQVHVACRSICKCSNGCKCLQTSQWDACRSKRLCPCAVATSWTPAYLQSRRITELYWQAAYDLLEAGLSYESICHIYDLTSFYFITISGLLSLISSKNKQTSTKSDTRTSQFTEVPCLSLQLCGPWRIQKISSKFHEAYEGRWELGLLHALQPLGPCCRSFLFGANLIHHQHFWPWRMLQSNMRSITTWSTRFFNFFDCMWLSSYIILCVSCHCHSTTLRFPHVIFSTTRVMASRRAWCGNMWNHAATGAGTSKRQAASKEKSCEFETGAPSPNLTYHVYSL